MPKKYTTTTTLVIVESPAKCKKIEEYLGPGYKCIASFGHLRELGTLKNVNINDNFKTTYTVIDDVVKKKQVALIKKEISKSSDIILATDDDREGEAIAWHICELFNLNIETTKRIVFHEITETAILNAIRNPTRININLVHAQQTRQILDILIGFKISPILRDCINKTSSLSAGRCQTPALKLIYDNHNDIKKSPGKKVYNISGYFTNNNILFSLTPENKYETDDDVLYYLNGAKNYQHIYNCSEPKLVSKKQPEPFTTSTLQQTASSELKLSPKETMSICQKLYENGYITYMRTDSKKYSKNFIDETKNYILLNYADGIKYINENIDSLSTKEQPSENQPKEPEKNLRQEAHEAIRPTNISLKELPDTFISREKKLYKLIWETSLESCMSVSTLFSITATISSFDNTCFTFTTQKMNFPGWMIVSKKYTADNKEYQYFLSMKKNTNINFKKIISSVSLKNLKSHYTEARLVQMLEEKGIGRPSTFSSIVDKIQEREYVKKEDISGITVECNDYILENENISKITTKREFGNEKGKLVIQQLGIVVMDFLNKNFDSLFEYNYTKQMEDDLDKISNGDKIWYEICKIYNCEIDELIKQNSSDDSKLEIKIDDNNSYVIRRFGPVIKCTETIDEKEVITYKSVRKDIDLQKLENGQYILDDVLSDAKKKPLTQITLGVYQNNDVILRRGKFGLFLTWGDNSKPLKELGNRPIESITFEEIEKYLCEGGNIVRNVSDNISIRKSNKGDYIFFKTDKMKKPKFFPIKDFKKNYKVCSLDELKIWLYDTYQIK
jgi:DNA topoisomerase-1